MAWWKILLICLISAFFFAFALTVAIGEIQIRMFLKPGSFWWNVVPWESNEHEPKDEFEAQRMSNEKRIRNEAEEWGKENFTEDWFIKSKDGLNLHAEFYESTSPSHNWVICVHGYKGCLGNIRCYGKNYHAAGYNVLLPENRTTGKSEGKYVGMGWLEKNDVMLWIQKIISLDSEAKIVLHGESMGCATVLMLSGDNLPENIRCIVADCGYTSVWDQFALVMKKSMHISPFPLLYASSALSKIKLGYGFKEASSVNQLKKSHTPTIFLHGQEDDFIPPSMSEKNYETLNAPKELHFFPHAWHCESEFYDPELYWSTVWNFVNKWMNL